ncbi:MAG: DNA mismatch repair protein MutS [Fimbriiglobus sp.]|nr:DNA mismatch repair protein MutS [Fimbriiglobus sp.]
MTPMMQQLQAARDAHPGMVVLFQNGEFFELFGDDAELGHRVIGLTLTKREETPMAGFPLAKLDHYLRQLLAAGHRVAVVEQMEPPATDGKKIIRREVTRVVTLGTVTEDELLDPKRPNHIAAVCRNKAGVFGVAWADLTAGTFAASDLDANQLSDELARLGPAECLLSESDQAELKPRLGGGPRSVTPRPAWTFDPTTALDVLRSHFQVGTLTGFGFNDKQPCLVAAGALLGYLRETVKTDLGVLRRITPHRPDAFLILDEVTRRSLELTRTLRENQRDGSLLSVIDRTVTPMGARFLHDNLLAPLNTIPAIEARLGAVEELLHEHSLRGDLRELLETTGDLHRLTTRIGTARATPKDLAAVGRTLRLLPKLKAKLAGRKSPLLNELEGKLELVPDLRQLLDESLVDDPPYSPKDGGIIRDGYHAELDELKRLSRDGKDWIAKFQAAEITRTGINSLKVGFTDVMGYYIEITNANENRVPTDYIHERTLKNAKRYITPNLKEYEEKILTAQEKSQALEFELFLKIRDQLAAQTHRLLQTADVIAQVDFLAGLAELASLRNYVRPVMADTPTLDIRDGRHPVLDQILPPGTFVPNDTRLSVDDGTFWLVTGPNMAGKSSFLRQTAVITLLAHIGSFVPAKVAHVGLTDRIFTRVGASDELSRGQSTFMVEMTEAANILNNASPRSLVILDEIGRGTATYDGLSLAWAITEYLHDVPACRTLFATHYHELASLAERLPRLRNYTVQVKELADEVIFLHKLAPGSAGKSYGLHVARLAGVPEPVLKRAAEVLANLESPKAAAPAEPLKPIRRPASVTQGTVVAPPEAARPKRKVSKPVGPSLFGDEE